MDSQTTTLALAGLAGVATWMAWTSTNRVTALLEEQEMRKNLREAYEQGRDDQGNQNQIQFLQYQLEQAAGRESYLQWALQKTGNWLMQDARQKLDNYGKASEAVGASTERLRKLEEEIGELRGTRARR